MEEKTMTPKHRDVVVKLRERIEQYRRRHSDCQSKQERSLAVIEDQERQDALYLHKRVLESRNTKLLNKIKQQEIAKIEHPSNGLDRELKSTNAILQHLKRKHELGLNNLHMNCDGENGQIGESLSKYSRSDDINNPGASASSHEHQIALQQSSGDQQATQSDSFNNPKSTTLVGNNGHFVGDTSRSSPLLAPSGTHTSEAFQNANRVSSPKSLPPTEFKQDSSHSAVTSDGGRANGITQNNSTRSSTETKTADSVAGQELQEQLNDFERVLMSITNNDMYKTTGMNPDMAASQHHQISTRQTPSQLDAVTRDSLNPQQQQQSPSVLNPSSAQQNPYPTPATQGPPGPTALHLQQLARQAQSQRAQTNPSFMEGQEQESSQRYRSQQMQFMEVIRFAASGSQQQLQSQTSMQPAQFSASRYRGAMATTSDQYANMYKDQNHNVIMSTGFPSNSTMSLQYQRMMQTQAAQQQQQQALYSRMGQQGMGQRLSHPSVPEHQQSSYPAYQPHQNMPQSQYNGMQNLPAYSNSAFQNIRSNQTSFSRQLSMPTSQGYQEQQYPQSMNQYPMGDQQVPSQQQNDLSGTSYNNYNRRNSFPLYHRSVSQPVTNYGPAAPHPGGPHPGYQPQVNQMRNNVPAPNSAGAATLIEGRNNPQPAGYSYNNQTSFATQSGLQALMQLPQRNGPAMSQAGTLQPRTDPQNMQGYATASMRETTNLSQEMKYSTRNDIPKNTRGPAFSDPLSLTDPTSTSSSDAHFNPFLPLGSLEKAPSFASLLEQSSGPLNNLETTYTGSIPNLDLLGEIIG